MTNITEKQVLALDIGGTSAKYAFVDAQGALRAKDKFDTAGIRSFAVFFERLCAVVAAARAQGITQVGISCPGVFDDAGVCMGNVENLPYLSGMNLPALLKAAYPDVEIHIGNDGNAAAMGEYWCGAAQGSPCFLCMTLGTGIGGALVIDGKPHLGAHFQSGEIGYINYQSPEEYYEKRYSTKGILAILAKRLGIARLSGRDFTKEVERQTPVYTETFAEWVDALGQLLANMVFVVDPERIVVGGGISREKALLLPALEAAMNRHLPPSFQDKTVLEMAQCGNDAGLLGAACPFFM